jgi:hypothetical protein
MPLLCHTPAFGSGLVVYGEAFSFMVSEPVNWIGDTDNAVKMQANIIFYKNQPASRAAVIRVRVNDKVDENTMEDLSYDMQQYQANYPDLRFSDISVAHHRYRVFPKLFFIPNVFYEYVAYVNPGADVDKMFSVSMNVKNREATTDELNAYKRVIDSLLFISQDINN